MGRAKVKLKERNRGAPKLGEDFKQTPRGQPRREIQGLARLRRRGI